jgi:hypothetical protein
MSNTNTSSSTLIEQHKTSIYIVKYNNRLYLVSHRPTDSYIGQKDSDQWTNIVGLHINDISHDLWIGQTTCRINTMTPSGIYQQKDLQAEIVAKKSFIWDYSMPMGKREIEAKQTKNFIAMMDAYKNQK